MQEIEKCTEQEDRMALYQVVVRKKKAAIRSVHFYRATQSARYLL